MRLIPLLRPIFLCVLISAPLCTARGQYIETFEEPVLAKDPQAVNGWAYFTGDGNARMTFEASQGVGVISVDATADRRNIWWALIKRRVSDHLERAERLKPGAEFRIEVRVRTSVAPRRVNLHLNTPSTTDFHSHLMEYDLAEANTWYTISLTTRGFGAGPEQPVFAQLALMDWGLGSYRLEIDYFRVDVVHSAMADLGDPIPYHPAVPDARSFQHVVLAGESATVDRSEPDANLGDWAVMGKDGAVPSLALGRALYPIVRFDLSGFKGARAAAGILELTTVSVHRRAQRSKDFGMMRVVEILGGDPVWTRDAVTFTSLLNGRAVEDVFNGQMVIDVEVNDEPGGKTYATLPRAVMQRLIDGRTKGIVLLPLGSIQAAFHQSDTSAGSSPRLLFNTVQPPALTLTP